MDYKQGAYTLSDTGQLGPSPYADFGNFNFGAVGAAFGIPLKGLLKGAGWAQDRQVRPLRNGVIRKGGPPYGDDPNDQAQIIAGYNYYKAGCYKHS